MHMFEHLIFQQVGGTTIETKRPLSHRCYHWASVNGWDRAWSISIGVWDRTPCGYEYHLKMEIVAWLAKLIHMALRLECRGRKTEILTSHVPPDKAQKDDYHIEWLGGLAETTMWVPESLREES